MRATVSTPDDTPRILTPTMRALLAELHRTLEAGRDCVWCSVVETRGSTPQKAGAAMLVLPDGRQVGTLGGGCVEAEVKRRALETLDLGRDAVALPVLLTFNLDDNYGWDDGLICGGRMLILAEPLIAGAGRHEEALRYYGRLQRMLEAGEGVTEAVVTNPATSGAPAGSRYLFDADENLVDRLGPEAAVETVRRGLVPLEKRPRAGHAHGVAYLPSLPRVTLFVVGGGHVGQAVAQLAATLDFDVWALDDRAAYVSPERFPQASRRMVGEIGAQLREIAPQLTPSVYALIVTRGHAHDEEALYHLAATRAGYVGMIGSKRKIKLIYDDLLARGVSAEALARVHAPLGLAIGSQTVPEIAVSIVAELIAVRNLGRSIPEARVRVKV